MTDDEREDYLMNEQQNTLPPATGSEAVWQPISTAPKDGTRLLLWCIDQIEVGYWSTSLWVTRPADSALGKQEGAWIPYEARSDTIELFASHWKPLPLPPNKA